MFWSAVNALKFWSSLDWLLFATAHCAYVFTEKSEFFSVWSLSVDSNHPEAEDFEVQDGFVHYGTTIKLVCTVTRYALPRLVCPAFYSIVSIRASSLVVSSHVVLRNFCLLFERRFLRTLTGKCCYLDSVRRAFVTINPNSVHVSTTYVCHKPSLWSEKSKSEEKTKQMLKAFSKEKAEGLTANQDRKENLFFSCRSLGRWTKRTPWSTVTNQFRNCTSVLFISRTPTVSIFVFLRSK